jgi:dienelactone hydrolase
MKLQLLSCAVAILALAPSATSPRVLAQAPAAPAALPAPPSWDNLQAAYDYQASVPDAKFHLERIALRDEAGKFIPGLFLRPKAAGTYPVVLLLHGLTSDKETMIDSFGRSLAAQGFACLALDAREHGERMTPGTQWNIGALMAPKKDGAPDAAADAGAGLRFAAVMKGTVSDYRRALDYLETRKDVDAQRIGLLGYSMGAMMGAIVAGVDTRVKATALEVGGDPIRPLAATVPPILRESVEAISPSNYIGHIAPRPVLLINAQADQIMPQAAAKLLQDAAREPKQIVWANGGHILPVADAARGVTWLVQTLNAPAAQSAPAAAK